MECKSAYFNKVLSYEVISQNIRDVMHIAVIYIIVMKSKTFNRLQEINVKYTRSNVLNITEFVCNASERFRKVRSSNLLFDRSTLVNVYTESNKQHEQWLPKKTLLDIDSMSL